MMFVEPSAHAETKVLSNLSEGVTCERLDFCQRRRLVSMRRDYAKSGGNPDL